MSYLDYSYRWKRLPSRLTNAQSLAELKWQKEGVGAANTAALMIYLAIGFFAVQKDDEASGLTAGEAAVTYERLREFTGLSRALISSGLGLLREWNLIDTRMIGRRAVHRICHFHDRNFMKIPCRYFYRSGTIISPLPNLSVRSQHTLNAMKLYFLIMGRRDIRNNHTVMAYPKLEFYSGVSKAKIKKALSVLVHENLIFVDLGRRYAGDYRHNIYRVRGIDDYVNLGTLPDKDVENLLEIDSA